MPIYTELAFYSAAVSSLDNLYFSGRLCKQIISESRGVGTGVYRYIYPLKSVYFTNFYVVTGCFFFSLTQDKLFLILKLE